MNVTNSICVIDEGHNAEDVCLDSAHKSMLFSTILETKETLEQVNRLRQMVGLPRFTVVLWALGRLSSVGPRFHSESEFRDLGEVKVLATTAQQFFDSLGIEWEDLLGIGREALELSDWVRKEPLEGRSLSPLSLELLQTLVEIPFLMQNEESARQASDGFRVLLTKPSQQTLIVIEDKWTVEFVCLYPKKIIGPLYDHCRVLILSSGTLSPLPSIASELGLEGFDALEAPRVVSPGQLWVGTFTTGTQGNELLSTSFHLRDSESLMTDLGESLLSLVQVIPNGVLVFFTSYGYVFFLNFKQL
jgi:regulator of telomere elongation helicase 1